MTFNIYFKTCTNIWYT